MIGEATLVPPKTLGQYLLPGLAASRFAKRVEGGPQGHRQRVRQRAAGLQQAEARR